MQGGKKKKEGKNDAWRWLTPPFSISPLLSSGWKREAHVRTEKDARSPSFSPSLPLPFLSILRTTTHRFPTRQRRQRCVFVCVCVLFYSTSLSGKSLHFRFSFSVSPECQRRHQSVTWVILSGLNWWEKKKKSSFLFSGALPVYSLPLSWQKPLKLPPC